MNPSSGWVACPPAAVIADHVEERLSPEESAAVRAHVEGCADCRRKVALAMPIPTELTVRASPIARSRVTPASFVPIGSEGDPPPRSDDIAAGERVGRYVIVAPLGSGGMGVVYLAYDPELDRRVALKLLRPEVSKGQTSSGGKGRLLREAQAMAKLNHPNVVAIFDVGTHGDEVFLAMELVEGTTVRQWMRDQKRSWQEVLEVFIAAGRGLAAAHGAGLIHRDFKPSNILLAKDGRVAVTDFGVARAMGEAPEPRASIPAGVETDEISERGLLATPMTRVGAVIGTPAYMAPEQLLAQAIDARTDEFSFCVSLYEALYGARPFGKRVDPSSDLALPAQPPGSKVPAWLRAVVAKGLSRDAGLRYPDMAALLDALSRDRGLWARRTAGLAAAAALVAVAAFIGYSVSRRSDVCASPQSHLAGVWDGPAQSAVHAAMIATHDPGAETAWAYTRGAMDRAATAWVGAYRAACEDTRVKHEQSESALALRLDCLDRQRTQMAAVSELFLHADAALIGSASGAAASLPLPIDCSDARAMAVVEPPSAAVALKVGELRRRLAAAEALSGAGKDREAMESLGPTVEEIERTGYQPLAAEALLALATSQARQSDFKGSAASAARALDIAQAVRMDQLAAQAAVRRLNSLCLGSNAAEVEALIEPTRLLVQRVRNDVLAAAGFDGALGICLMNLGRPEEALAHEQKAEAVIEQVYGPNRPETLNELNNLGAGYDSVGKYDEEERIFRKALEVSDSVFGPDSNNANVLLSNLSMVEADMGRLEESLPFIARALSLAAKHGESLYSLLALANQARVSVELGKRAEGLAQAEAALAEGTKLGLTEAPDFSTALRLIAEAQLGAGKPDLAVKTFERLQTLQEKEVDPKSPDWVEYLRVGGAAYLAAGNPAQARAVLQRALDLAGVRRWYPGWIGEIRLNLSRSMAATGGDPKRIAELRKQASDELEKLPSKRALLVETER